MGAGASATTTDITKLLQTATPDAVATGLESLSPEDFQRVKQALGAPKKKAGSLGIIRLDYDYPPAPGDIDHPGSYQYDVYYRVVPGLTFEVCQYWPTMKTPELEAEFIEAIKWLDEVKGVTGITGDCGFMMYMQKLARNHTKKPVFMSALTQLPAVTCGYAKNEKIAIMTANGQSLQPMRDLIREECGVDDPDNQRYIFVGCENVKGFEAVAVGDKVPVKHVMPGIIQLAKDTIAAHPDIRCFLQECTELPAYSDAIRLHTGLPVYDAITGCNGFMSGVQDNPLFGLNDWQHEWDGNQEKYTFGQNLDAEDLEDVENKQALAARANTATVQVNDVVQHTRPTKDAAGCLGIVRLDYNYPPAPGDIDHPGSYMYDVHYRSVPGYTFEVCQWWDDQKTEAIENEIELAIKYLENEKKVDAIAGDCGFMMYIQKHVRRHTKKPVVMSALAQLPAIICALAADELVAIFTANGKSLTPMLPLIKEECGLDLEQKRFVIVGCENVPGFEAVAVGGKVDTKAVQPGVVALAQQTIAENPGIRVILFECTELPSYSDAVRHATGLPVYDAITGCNYFLSGVQDNPLFGLQNWQKQWDKKQDEYHFGQNLSQEKQDQLVTEH